MRREERRRAAPPSPLLVGEMSDGETGAEPAGGAGVTGIWVVTALYGALVVTGSSNVGIAGGDEPGRKTAGLRTVTGSTSAAACAVGGLEALGAGDDGLGTPIAAGAGVGPATFGGDDGDNLVPDPAPGPVRVAVRPRGTGDGGARIGGLDRAGRGISWGAGIDGSFPGSALPPAAGGVPSAEMGRPDESSLIAASLPYQRR